MTNECLTAIRLLSSPGQVVEVRAITEDGVASGYFDSPKELAERVETLDCLPTVQGIYVTLNPVDPALFARRANRIKTRLGKKDATTADSDIVRRQWLPVDIDPVRPSGVSSTNAEHDAAIATARRVAAFLTETGFPAPVLADSGNGAHLLYSIDLPNDDPSRLLVKRCLAVLDTLFSDDRATIDTANFNAGRIWKLYGTVSRKGDNTSERPHRRSAIIDAPLVSAIVEQAMLERLAGSLPVTPPADDAGNQPAGHRIVLSQWLSDHGIGVNVEKPYEGGTLYQLEECPFSDTHKDGAYAIQFPNGACYAGCHHDSCGSGKQRWQELRARYEPAVEKPTLPAQKKTAPQRVPPMPAMAELPGKEEALAILRDGNPKQEMLRTFALDHEGDETVAECLILSIASRAVLNTNGLHVSVTGESGKGKSHAFATFLQQVPERFRLDGAMSNKALFYIDELQPGSVIVLDDTSMSEDMAEILKGVTSTFRKPFVYRTVNKDRKGINCTIPERCVWWVAKVEGSGDDQVFNRMLTCWIDDSSKQDDRVLTRVLEESATLPDHGMQDRPEVLICRAIWELVGQELLHVVIPYATRIRFQVMDNRRNPGMLLDIVKANAVLMAQQRERQVVDGVACITATREDFDAAVKLYGLLNGTDGGQGTKLTRKESNLITTIEQSKWTEFTIAMLQKATGYTNGGIYRIVHGYTSRGVTYTGLLEKCPAIAYCDRTVAADDDFTGVSMRRRTNAYTFDQDLYHQWQMGGSVWIEDANPSDDKPGHGDPGIDDTKPPAVQQQVNISPAVQQLSSSSPATAGENEINATAADCGNKYNYTHLGTSDQVLSSKSVVMQQPAIATSSAPFHIGVPAIAGEQKQKTAEQPQNCEPTHIEAPFALQQLLERCSKKGGLAGEETGSTAGKMIADRRKICAVDYKLLAIPEPHTPCCSCGKKGSWYVEKLTAERRARPKDDQAARRVCRKCYDAAVRRDRAAAPPLPGVINLDTLEQCSGTLGRCTVCNLSGAVYIDRDTGTKLCKACHSREVQRQCPKTGVPV